MANPKAVRGIRQSAPSGTVLGRTDPGVGPVRALTIKELAFGVAATGAVVSAAQGASTAAAAATIYAPLVNGDIPGPDLIADPAGQTIMVQSR